jgi:hypothetical protein
MVDQFNIAVVGDFPNQGWGNPQLFPVNLAVGFLAYLSNCL